MRDPKRIDKYIKELQSNLANNNLFVIIDKLRVQENSDLFYLEDEKLFPKLIKKIQEEKIEIKADDNTEEFLKIIQEIWKDYPDMRFGQLIYNIQFRGL